VPDVLVRDPPLLLPRGPDGLSVQLVESALWLSPGFYFGSRAIVASIYCCHWFSFMLR
jgi:hypothetical protein